MPKSWTRSNQAIRTRGKPPKTKTFYYLVEKDNHLAVGETTLPQKVFEASLPDLKLESSKVIAFGGFKVTKVSNNARKDSIWEFIIGGFRILVDCDVPHFKDCGNPILRMPMFFDHLKVRNVETLCHKANMVFTGQR